MSASRRKQDVNGALAGLREVTLSNGLRVLILPGGGAPVATTVMGYRAGTHWEPPGQTGISHFLEHMMFKGTEVLPKGEIDRATQSMGGENNAFTWIEDTCYFFSMPLDQWRRSLEIEADRMRGCRLDPREFDLEKAVVLEESLMVWDTPQAAVYHAVRRAAYPDQPAGWPIIGLPKDVADLTPEGMRSYYDRFYHPSNAILAVAGRIDPEEVLAEVHRLFDPIPAGPGPAPAAEPPRFHPRREPLVIQRPAEAPILCVAYPLVSARDPAWPAVELLRGILTDGWTARLTRRLVLDTQVAIRVDVLAFETRVPDALILDVQLRPGVPPQEALALLDRELEAIRRTPPEPWELEKARRLYEVGLRMDYQRSAQRAIALVENALLDEPDWSYRLLGSLGRVTPGEVREAARRFLDPDQRVVGILEPGSGGLGAEHLPTMVELPEVAPEPAPAEPAVEASPPPLPPVRFAPLAPVRRRLANGMELVFLHRPGCPSVAIRAAVDAGSSADPDGASGLAALTSSCLRRGTERWTEPELNRFLEERGIRLVGSAGLLGSMISLSCLPENLEAGWEALAQVLRHPALASEEVERQKALAGAALAAAEDDPAQAGFRRFREIAFEGDPLGRPIHGRPAELQGIRVEQVRAFHELQYRPHRIRLYCVGAFELEGEAERLEALLGDWERSPETPRSLQAPPEALPAPMVVLHRMEREQAHLYLGHRGLARRDPDYPASMVLNQVLGSSAGLADRLNRILRDSEGLAYTVHAGFETSSGAAPGIFMAYIGTSPENTRRALDGILREIRRLQQSAVEPEELVRARNAVIGGLLFSFETAEDLAEYLRLADKIGCEDGLRQEVADQVAAVTAADLQGVARRWLRPEAMRLVASGAVDAEQVAAAGFRIE